MALGQIVCTVPAERWRHRAVYFSDETIYIYGGFAPRCADFCDDLWMFDLNMRAWREVYAAGELSHLDGFLDSYGWGGPGKRWKFSMTNDDEIVAIFGGFRLWHGYAQENAESNDWTNYQSLPPGGYLNDLWFYTKTLDFTTVPGLTFKTTVGERSPDKFCSSSSLPHCHLFPRSQESGKRCCLAASAPLILASHGSRGP
jgi:hypothetical protein